MTVTTSLGWIFNGDLLLMNNISTAGSQRGPNAAANFARTEYFGVWEDPNKDIDSEGRIIKTDGTPVTNEFHVSPPATTFGDYPDVAGLKGGNFVAVYADFETNSGGDIRGHLFSATGASGADFGIDTNDATSDSHPTVAALADGGFVVAYDRTYSGGDDVDVLTRVLNANGTQRTGEVKVDGSLHAQHAPDVAGLTNGNFVVVYQNDADHGVYFHRYTANGTSLDAPSKLITKSLGGQAIEDIQVVAVDNGGFAVAFTDGAWGGGTDISFKVYNADGSARSVSATSGLIRANDTTLGGIVAGVQDHPTITTLGSGHIVVGWRDENGNSYGQAFDSAGHAVGRDQVMAFGAVDPAFAGLSGGSMAIVYTSTDSEGAGKGNSIKSEVAELVRQFVGDGDNDTFTGINDGLRETFSGGGGNDTFDGKAGGDVFFGSAGTDTASYASAPTGVVANLGNSSLNTGDAAGDAYSSIENLRGSAFADRLTGDGGVNVVDGAGGDDIVDGGGAGDAMRGGAGNDTYVVDNPSDVVDESIAGSTGADTVRSLISFSLADGAHAKGNIENLTLVGNSDFNITGNLLANRLTGNAGANILDGGLNDDTLNGGLGNDVLIGSAGRDSLVFNTALGAGNVDTVVSFSVPDDTIDLDNAIFAKLTATGVLKDKFFHIGKHADDHKDYILYNKKTGALSYDADGSKHKIAPIEFAQLDSHLHLKHGDFLVV